MQNERFKGMQTREMQLSGIRVLNEDDRTVELSFSSETPIERWGAFEVLSHTKSAVQLNRILTTGCLLYNHNRDTVIGKICSAKVENKRGVAVVQFDEDEKSDIIFQKVKNGSLRGVSVGYTIQDYKKDVTGQERHDKLPILQQNGNRMKYLLFLFRQTYLLESGEVWKMT